MGVIDEHLRCIPSSTNWSGKRTMLRAARKTRHNLKLKFDFWSMIEVVCDNATYIDVVAIQQPDAEQKLVDDAETK